MKIVECVPNFSEGRDRSVIDAITEAITSAEDIRLLNVDMGESANRTVVTFLGTDESVREGAFRGIDKASQLIDMRRHKGTHPRMGATDVCPFVPVRDIGMPEVDTCARDVARRVGEALEIPVFLYEQSATSPVRENLAAIRSGEYEGMAEKLKSSRWKPDFGPDRLNEKSGCTAIGAREFLIAFNINLDTVNPDHARDIALELRQIGRVARTGETEPFYSHGEILRYAEDDFACGTCEYRANSLDVLAEHTQNSHEYDLLRLFEEHRYTPDDLIGKGVVRPGKFKYVKALGWYVPEYGCAQITMNLTNYRVTPLHAVYEEAKRQAGRRGLRVTGSEIVGLVPYDALRMAGAFYQEQYGHAGESVPEELLEIAVESLGLRDKTEFDIREKVLGLPGDDYQL